jgi:hypothetical protein
MIIIVVY